MKKLSKPLCTGLSLILTLCSTAQEKLGIANSNYLSTQSIFLNPSSSADSKTYMQLNLISAGAFVMSNVAYIPGFSVYGHKGNEAYIQNPVLSSIKLPKFIYANATVEGPSFVISKRNYGAGFFVRARSVVQGNASSLSLVNALVSKENTGGSETMNVNAKNTRVSSMSWLEYGVNFSKIIKKERTNLWSVGVNLRYLSGINFMYANLTELKGYYNDTLVHVENMNGKIRFTDLALNSGRGLGADLGVTYKKMLSDVNSYYPNSVRCNCKTMDYKYKVSVALRDVGYIRFKKNTSSANVSGSGDYYTDRNDTSYKAAVASLLNTEFSSKPILASLPTALVGQLDWNFENNLYVNATIVKNIMPNSFTGVQSTNLISITPRYEWKQFEIAAPLTFHQFIYPQVGMALRYRSFAIGVDNIFPFIKAKNTYGAGVYFSAAISLFKNPACRKKLRKVDLCPTKILKNSGI